MATRYDRNNNTFTHVGVPFNYTRGNPLPLDDSTVWTSKAAAETYAQTSPVAYVGQVLTVADPAETTATVYVISNTAGELTEVGTCSNDYDKLTDVKDFLYEIEFSQDYNYSRATAYFEKIRPVVNSGACTTFRKGVIVGRNLDWTYNNKADFIVRTRKTATRHASIGLGGNVNALTNDVVKSRAYSPFYWLVPFLMSDGMNDAGVFVSSHVVPSGDYGKTTGTKPDAPLTLCNYMIPRYVLDNCSSALEAIEKLQNDVNIYCATKDAAGNTEECAYFIADRVRTYVVEFINNEVKVSNISGRPWEANFYRHNTETLNDRMSYTDSGITDHGMGVERWNIVAERYDALTNEASFMSLLRDLFYTHSYTNETDKWYSEYVGGNIKLFDIVAMPEKFDAPMQEWKEKFLNRTRDESDPNFGTWHSMHSCVYNLSKMELWVVGQENNLDQSVFRAFDDDDKSDEHAHAFVECWDMTSSSTTINGTHMVPATLVIDSVGYQGYLDANSNTFVYYTGGQWKLHATSARGGDKVLGTGSKNDDFFAIQDYPSSGNVTRLIRHESTVESDRLVTERTDGPVGAVVFKGTTTTEINADASTPTSITMSDSTTLTVFKGLLVMYIRSGMGVMYMWDGEKWREYGAIERKTLFNLKAMAYAPKAKAEYTPAGTVATEDATVEADQVTNPTFTGTPVTPTASFAGSSGNVSAKGTPTGTVSQPTFTGTPVTPSGTFTGTEGNLSITGTPTGIVTTPTFTGESVTPSGSFTGTAGNVSVSGTPSGTVSQPSFTGTPVTPTAGFAGAEGNVSATGTPSGTVSAPTVSVELATSTFKKPVVELDTENGELKITDSDDITFATGSVSKAEASAPTFSGASLTVTGKFTPSGTVTVDPITPGGTVSQPTFDGDALTSTGTFTPAGSVAMSAFTPTGTISQPEFLGDSLTLFGRFTPAGTVTISPITPAGTVSQPTFSGAEMTATGTFTPSGAVTVSPITPAGTNSGMAVTLKAHKHTASFSGTKADIISDPHTPAT